MPDAIGAYCRNTATRRRLSRRHSLKLGLLTGLAIASNIDPILANEELDIGLVAPFTGADAEVGDKVLESLRTHQQDDNGDPIYPEFEGKKLVIFSRDSISQAPLALTETRRLVEDNGLVHLVCGDIRSEAIKVKEPFCKQHNVDLIQACSRLKLNHSNPHPHTFQILPNLQSYVTQCFEFLQSRNIDNSNPALVVVDAGTTGFWNNQAPSLFTGASGFGAEVLSGSPNDLVGGIQTAIQQAPGRPVMLFSNLTSELLEGLAPTLGSSPILIDSFLSDPEDLRGRLPGQFSEQIYFAGIASRALPASPFQAEFYQRIRALFDREPTPIDTLGGTALQITARFANGAAAEDIDLNADETMFGSPVAFDEQGANIGGRTRYFLVNDGLQDVTPG